MEQMKGIEPSCRPWQGRVLPLNYICIKMAVRTGLEPAISSVTGRHVNHYTTGPYSVLMEQMKGIEPSCRPWQGRVLPLNYICIKMAVRTGLEPAISSVTGRHVNHYTTGPLFGMAKKEGFEPSRRFPDLCP